MIAIPALLAVIVVFLLSWLRQRDVVDYKQFFSDNQQELTLYADAFLEQDCIGGISRFRNFNGVNYNVIVKNDVTYGKTARISFTVPYWEKPYWKVSDISGIRADYWYPNMTLGSFLTANGITEEEFLKWRAYLTDNDFLAIGGVYGEENMLEISKTNWSGFLYRKDPGLDFGYAPSFIDMLNDNWCYYNEQGIPYPRD